MSESVLSVSADAVLGHEFLTFRIAVEEYGIDILKVIAVALEACGGNVVHAARQLGLGRSTLYKKMVALGIA